MSICKKKTYFKVKKLKSGFVTNVKCREEPGFGMFLFVLPKVSNN